MARLRRILSGATGPVIGAFVMALSLAPQPSAWAQPVVSGQRVPTVTLLVRLFSGRIDAIQQAVSAKDVAALERMLDPGFEMRTSASPATPVPRAQWVQAMVAAPHIAYQTGQMAVHEFPGVCVVSFTQTPARGSGASPLFVVDTWAGSGDDWVLRSRYVSAAGPIRGPVPGQPKQGASIPKKY